MTRYFSVIGIELELLAGDEPEQGVEFEIVTAPDGDRPDDWDRDLDAMEREQTLLADIAHAPPRDPPAPVVASPCLMCGRLPHEKCHLGWLCPSREIP